MRSRRSPQGINTLQMLAADCWGAVDLRYGVDEGLAISLSSRAATVLPTT